MADWSENEANFSLRQAHEVKEVPSYVFDSEVPSEKTTVSVHDPHPHLLKNVFLKKFCSIPATGFLFLIITEQAARN